MPARESEKTSAARRPRLMEMFLQIPRVFAGCPAGVPAYLKLFEWSLIEHTFLSFLLSSSSPPPNYIPPSLSFFSSPSKKNLLVIIVRFFFSSTFAHKRYVSPPTSYIYFSFFIILLLSKQMKVWIKSRNCVCHFVFFMQYVVKCTMSWFTRSIRKVFV